MPRLLLPRLLIPAAVGLLLMALANAQSPNPPPPGPSTAERLARAAAVRQLLNEPVDFRGFDDPDTKLGEGLDYLARQYGVRFDINVKAFKEGGIEDVLAKALGREIPKAKGAPLAAVLRKVMDRIDVESGTTWVVRSDAIEVTTVRAYRAEFYPGRPDGPFPPLVVATFEKTPLEDALKQLADETDGNVVLDVRAGDKAKAPVSARLANVPLDTAVLLLADMAGLKSVEVDGVHYVTSRENARVLRDEQAKARAARAEKSKATKDQAAPAPAETEPMAKGPKEREEQLRRLKATVEGKQPPK